MPQPWSVAAPSAALRFTPGARSRLVAGPRPYGSLKGQRPGPKEPSAGCLYQAALRQQLSRRLGVARTYVRNGTAEIDGVPRPVIEAFSRRRAEDGVAGTDLGQAWAAAPTPSSTYKPG